MRTPARKRKLADEEIDRFYAHLHNTPGYRELIRQRISDEQKRRRRRDFLFASREKAAISRYGRKDVDKLGREVEGCG